MPQTYRIKLSDGREFDVQTEGGPPSESDVLSGLGGGEQASAPPAGPQGSAVGRFASNAWDVLNPVAAVKGMYDAVTSPIETGKAMYGAQMNQLDKAKQAFSEGRYSEMVGHGAAAALPLVGPVAAEAGEQIGAGDIAGGLGKMTGIVMPFGMASAAKRFGLRVMPNKLADSLDAGAAARVADVMSPKSSAQKGLRMTAKAEKIAPDLVKDGGTSAWSRSGLKDNFSAKFDEAALSLDEAADARNAGKPYDTAEIMGALRAERAKLTAQPFDADLPARKVVTTESKILDGSGRPIRSTRQHAEPVGQEVVPHHNKSQVAEIDRAIAEVEALGPIAPYESLRRIRASYDKPAQVKYNPAMTPDFLANQSVAEGAANVTGVIRDVLAKGDPETAAANAQYSLYKSARDIVTAAEELEKARPKVGRRLMSQLTGSMIGGQAGGTTGAIAGFALGPMVDSMMSAGVTTQLQTARLMSEMAKAIRGGNQTKALQLQFKLRDLAKQTAKAEVIRGTATQATQPQLQ